MEFFYQNDNVILCCASMKDALENLDFQFDCCISNYVPDILDFGDRLRQNGKCIVFSTEPDTTRLRKRGHTKMYFNYPMVWIKNKNYFEDISVFQKKYDFSQTSMRDYSKKVYDYIGKPRSEIYKELGNTCADHFFRFGSLQFQLPTKETYDKLIDIFHIDKMIGFLDFENLERTYSIFNLDGRKRSNVLVFDKDKEFYGNSQKPVALIEDLIRTYTNDGDLILDVSAGAGTLGIACMNTNRRCVLIESDKMLCEQIKDRCEKHSDFKQSCLF